jgi:hypothetical protein
MNVFSRAAARLNKVAVARMLLTVAGAAAMLWAAIVFPTFWSEKLIVDVAAAIARGEVFDPDVLAAVEAPTEGKGSSLRAGILSNVAMIRLRQLENAVHAGNSGLIQQRLASTTRIVGDTLRNAPDDPFVWLVLFSLDTYRNKVTPESVRYLRMSYELGPYEGWVAVKRDGAALGSFNALPPDLRERAIAEFVRMVRWGIDTQAADIAAGPARPLRAMLFAKLKTLSYPQRRAFADVLYGREIDDVPVPGIPPPPAGTMPVAPPE